ncbi:hypothetical protein SMF913_25116 [Streptomyces malaysiensis]|uniref:Uncharacterized protein n=1 Tax=Streptomyces malaysiensis TaxID=92644 RepID=A0A2J7YNQ4_STRMQ|nr:hypothetical protein SMF913_25116 [Streptomyces malaysiensis]
MDHGCRGLDTRAQPAGLRDALHQSQQNLVCLPGQRGLRIGPRVGVQKAVDGGIREGEGDVEIPAVPHLFHRIARTDMSLLGREVVGKTAPRDGVEEPSHITKVAVDRLRLHPGRGADSARGHRLPTPLGEQVGGRLQDPLARLGDRFSLCHASTITVDSEH